MSNYHVTIMKDFMVLYNKVELLFQKSKVSEYQNSSVTEHKNHALTKLH